MDRKVEKTVRKTQHYFITKTFIETFLTSLIFLLPYHPKKGRPKFLSAQTFVTLGRFCHLGQTNNLGRRKFGLFLKFHVRVNFVFQYDISSFWLLNGRYML